MFSWSFAQCDIEIPRKLIHDEMVHNRGWIYGGYYDFKTVNYTKMTQDIDVNSKVDVMIFVAGCSSCDPYYKVEGSKVGSNIKQTLGTSSDVGIQVARQQDVCSVPSNTFRFNAGSVMHVTYGASSNCGSYSVDEYNLLVFFKRL